MTTIHHVFHATAPRDTGFAALTTTRGPSGWWTTIVKAEAGVGAIAHFTFAGDFNPDMRVTALEPLALVRWECAGGHEPWTQDTFRFELADKGDETIVRFWQDYARELNDDDYGTYNFNWGYYLESLRLFSNTGQMTESNP